MAHRVRLGFVAEEHADDFDLVIPASAGGVDEDGFVDGLYGIARNDLPVPVGEFLARFDRIIRTSVRARAGVVCSR